MRFFTIFNKKCLFIKLKMLKNDDFWRRMMNFEEKIENFGDIW
jgi:hypothetical protein